MKKSERDELARVVRLRAKVTRADIDRRKKDLLAEAEAQLSRTYRVDAGAWRDVTAAAKRAVEEADAQVARVCREMGIPEEFRPGLNLCWYGRGENMVKQRREELRRAAATRIEAAASAAKAAVEAKEAELLTALIAGGLESDDARAFLESLPAAQELLPASIVKELLASAPKPAPPDYDHE